MLKFFRNIRKKYLKEGKFLNYLKYALGEILLVVIGILIALQVNSWKEARRDRIDARYYREQMITELKQAQENLRMSIKYGKNAYESVVRAVEMIRSGNIDEQNRSEFEKNFTRTVSFPTYQSENGVLEELISTGKLGIFDEETRKRLVLYKSASRQYDIEIQQSFGQMLASFNELSDRIIISPHLITDVEQGKFLSSNDDINKNEPLASKALIISLLQQAAVMQLTRLMEDTQELQEFLETNEHP